MLTFAPHTLESAPAGARGTLKTVVEAWSFVPKLHGILAESPVALDAYEALFSLAGRAPLPLDERQLVFLAVSAFHGCEYCVAGHTYLARQAGLDEAVIRAVREGVQIADRRLQNLRDFTETVVRKRGQAGDARVEDFLAAGFTRANLLELVMIIATKTLSNYVNHLTHTPKEDFMSDPALNWVAPVAEAVDPIHAGGNGKAP
ncbi:carboxymuconolactone decarboxylase family protein [Nitratireductor soli]|uniref:carboxymuconolactone decarboxylase family protein n=1 Tax=Nitratireductor soli TaxID=1670619 RepID=UPI000AFC7DBA|nr:carboxymuconolactone decarboxylase family protein [Nitratireductor soli]